MSVLLGKGDGTFQTALGYSAGANPLSVAVGDFNGDGTADLAVANYYSNNLSVLIGNGDGTFQAAVNYGPGLGLGPLSVAVGDFNGDGIEDLAVGNNSSNNVSVLLGLAPVSQVAVAVTSSPSGAAFTVSGTGCTPGTYTTPANLVWIANTNCIVNFASPQTIANSLYFLSASTINGGSFSLANPRVVNSGAIASLTINAALAAPPVGAISPSSGTGAMQTFTGTYVAASGYQDVQWAQMLFAVAADGGGQAYCLVHYDAKGNRFWLYSDVLGYFLGPIAPLAASTALQGSLCALNTSGSSVAVYGNSLTVNASVVFKQALVLYIFTRAYSLEGADSGWVQQGTWNTAAGSTTTTTLTNVTPPAPLFGQAVTLTAQVTPALASGTVAFMDGGVLVGVGTLNASGIAQMTTITLPSGTHTLRAVYGGNSSSGYQASQSTALPYVVTAVSGGTFAPATGFGVGGFPHSVAVGDFNGDGKADLVTANGANSVSVLLGNGNRTFQTKVDYAAGNGPYSVAVGDFNGDGRADLATANYYRNSLSLLLGNGTGTFQTKVDYTTGNGPYSVAVGDFDGDGRADLVTANYYSNSVSVILGRGDGTFQAKVDYPIGGFPYSVAVGDFNGDGRADLATANTGSDRVSVLLGRGDGTFQTKVDYTAGNGSDSVAVGDFNGDGRADLVTANFYSNSLSVLLGNGSGTFQTKVDYTAGNGPSSVAVADINGDGRADLATANTGSDRVSVLLGRGDGTFQTKVDYTTGNGPYSVAVGDFDGDGRADLVTANSGSNSVSLLLGLVPVSQVAVAVTSSPSGAAFALTGPGCAPGTYTTPANLAWNANTNCTVNFTSPQTISSSQYVFRSSAVNGGSISSANPRVVNSGDIASLTINATFVEPPVVGTISPSSGSGAVQMFTGTYVAPAGYQDLQWVQILFAVGTDGGGQAFCYVHYDVQGNRFWLYSDVLGFFVGPIAPGATSNLLQGSFCALNTSGSSVSGSGNQLTVNAAVVFKAAGARNIYLRAMNLEGAETGWVQQGTWTAAATFLGTMTVAPSSGSVTNGTQQTFTLTYPDTPGFAGAAFGWEQFLVAVSSSSPGTNYCLVQYDRGGKGLWMYSSDVGFFLGPVAPGVSSTLLTSSACSVNTAGATVQNTSGNLVLTLPITLKAPMAGSQKLFQRALTVLNVDIGFVQTGTLTVN